MKLTSNEWNEFEDATKYRHLMGMLIYLTTTRLNISFVVGIVSRFMQKNYEIDWFATKRIIRYLKGTQDLGIKYSNVNTSNFLGTLIQTLMTTNGVYTSSYLMSLGSTTISWISCK